MLKALILIGGPQKGTRFRPLSLDTPKPLFPVAGLPIIQHHIEACARLEEIKEILLLGYYPASDLSQFIKNMMDEYQISIRYLQEFTPLGTAGGLYHFRDQIRIHNNEGFFVLNGDVCADFPLEELLTSHRSRTSPLVTVVGTETTRHQALHYGCMVVKQNTGEIDHYVEKPSTFVSTVINCGIYFCSLDLFNYVANIFNEKQQLNSSVAEMNNGGNDSISLELDVLAKLAGSGRAFALQTNRWWSQLKTASAAIYANRHYLQLYQSKHKERLALSDEICNIIGDVYIHKTANIDPSATLGPNVSIGSGAVIGPGVRLREAVVMDNATIGEHSLIIYSILGRNSKVGRWARVEGTPCDPNPNKPFAKMDNLPLFNKEGRLNPSITILGCSVSVPSEVIVLNSIVLPYKELNRSFKNEIIL